MSTTVANRKKRPSRIPAEPKIGQHRSDRKRYPISSEHDAEMQIREALAVYADTEQELSDDWKFAS